MSDELISVEKAVVSLSTVAGIVVTAIGALWKRNENRAERHEKRISQLEADIQRKVNFIHHNDAIEAIRKEQQASTERIMQGLSELNSQVIDVYKILINNKKD